MARPIIGKPKQSGYDFWALGGKLLPGLIFVVVLLLYILPNAAETLLIRWGAPPVVLVIFGDLAGCAVIAVVLNMRWALGIYLIASGIELALLRDAGISPGRLIWVTDLFPAAVVAALVVYAVCRGRNWRSFKVSPHPNSGTSRRAVVPPGRKSIAAKRLADIVLSGLAVLILFPFLLLIAATVWLFIGPPILFLQARAGHHGKLFQIRKFRTMTERRDVGGRLLPDEQRLTWFGKFLRRTSLDELPELWNVLKGEMTLVGPRPLLVKYLPLYTERQQRRHDVKPGVTGWAQVNGRNALTWEKKFELDIWYVDHWGLWLDIKILWLTLLKVWQRDGISQYGHATMPEFTGTTSIAGQHD